MQKLAFGLKAPKILRFFVVFVVKEKKMRKILLILAAILIVFEVFADEADKNACQYARQESDIETWASYLEKFPDGICAKEGQAFFKKIDSKLCKQAKQQNTFVNWYDYLQKFPEGKCSFEAKMTLKKQLKINNWSQKSAEMSWDDAIAYCDNLQENGYNDWRLPNIDELRTLIKNNSETELGGSCKISEKAGKLAYRDKDKKCDGGGYCFMGMYSYKCNDYSQFGDKERLLSSSRLSDSSDSMWYIDFNSGRIEAGIISLKVSDRESVGHFGHVRCVR